MTWSAVASAVTTIGKLLTSEASYLWGVEEQVDRLLTDLKWMQNFLTNEGGRQAGDGTFHLQAAEIRDLAYDAEDVVETFALKIGSRRKPGFTNCIKRSACILHEGWMLHQTRSEIDKIIAKSNDLVRRLNAYHPNKSRGGGEGPSCSTEMQEQRRPYPHIMDENIVGLDDNIKELVSILVDEGSEFRVVSICGTGGLGKTTLAKKIYGHRRITGHFQLLAFVYVSQLCQKRRVWEDILSNLTSIGERDRQQSDEKIAEKLFRFLEEKKCLLILDDIWSAQAWNSLKPAFSLQRNSKSKILLTSRNREIASHAETRCYVYELPRLTNDETWQLFQKITSPPTDSPEYKELGMKMAQRCPKLPLAIVALGGILAKKKNSVIGWREVSENVGFYLRDDKELKLEKVLELSYDDLPYHLRSIFVYLSQFPEDYTIWTCRLIQLLVAEGIVPQKQGEIAEDVAEGYLMELAERFMIQPREIDPATLKINTFQLHDEMRGLCLSKAEQENFIFIVDESNASSLSTIRDVRRVSMHKNFGAKYIRCPNLRSLSFFSTCGMFFQEGTPCEIYPFNRPSSFGDIFAEYISFLKARGFWVYIFTNLKLLRVLNYEGLVSYVGCKLIGDIENLIHLRFLSLNGLLFKGSKLPSSLGNLRYLQTLDLRVPEFDIINIPDVIWRMEQLRHLYLPFLCHYKIKWQLGTLINLLTLVNFNTTNCYLKDLINMTNLRELVIRWPFEIKDFNEEELDENPPIVEGKSLHSLSFESFQIIDPRYVNHLLSSCASICKLVLKVNISRLPELRYLSTNLAYIRLEKCFLERDPMPTLEQLPNLRVLELDRAFRENEMFCSAQGFPKLESLSLGNLSMEQWKVDEGAMPCLRQLEIASCERLKRLPYGLRFITTLQELKIISMPQAFKDKVVQGGRDFFKVQHVPSVKFLHERSW